MFGLQKAQRSIGQRAARQALTVVPALALAFCVTPAKAGILFFQFDGGASCSFSAGITGTGSCSDTQASPVGGDTNGNWVSLSGSGSAPEGGSLTFSITGGSAAGSILAGAEIPVAWDFAIQPLVSGDTPTVSYTLTFDICVQPDSSCVYSTYSTSGSSGVGTVTGTNEINVSTSGIVASYDMSATFTSSTRFGIDIPGGASLDMNTAAPEPATLLMVPAAGLWFFVRRRFRRA